MIAAADGRLHRSFAQNDIPEAAGGDTRLFLLDGRPLQVDGVYAAFRRIPADGEARANVRAGASVETAAVDEEMLGLVERVGPRLVADGMFFVGLEFVRRHLLEANVFSPGGLGTAESATGVDFVSVVIDALERKRDSAVESPARPPVRAPARP